MAWRVVGDVKSGAMMYGGVGDGRGNCARVMIFKGKKRTHAYANRIPLHTHSHSSTHNKMQEYRFGVLGWGGLWLGQTTITTRGIVEGGGLYLCVVHDGKCANLVAINRGSIQTSNMGVGGGE